MKMDAPSLPIVTKDEISVPHHIDPYTLDRKSENLLDTQRRFGLTAQIFNWQKTGLTFKLNAPIENTMNEPFLLLRVTPFWLNKNFFLDYSTAPQLWDTFRPWFLPVSNVFSQFVDTLPISKGVTIFEDDNAPLISLLAFHALGWTGGLDFQFRIVSNSTSQGKVVFSRMYDISRFYLYGAIEKTKTPFQIPSYSQSNRMNNGFVMQDLSSRNDLIVSCPYSEPTPWKSNVYPYLKGSSVITGANDLLYSTTDSYLALDIVESILPSAGANSVSIQVWIRAQPDFQIIGPTLVRNTIRDQNHSALWQPDHTTGAPPMNTFGFGGNWMFRDGKSTVGWSRIPEETDF